MSDKIEVVADDKTRRVISELHGAATALASLYLGGDPDKPKSQLPGFMLALALIEKEVADMRAQMAGAVYRCAAKAGHDVASIRSIYTSVGKDGVPIIQLEPADLIDAAESR